MEDNTVLVVLIIAVLILSVSILIYFEDKNETELETCIEGCEWNLPEYEEPTCILQCTIYFGNCSMGEGEG